MTRSYIKSYIKTRCGMNTTAWADHINSLTNETTGRIEVSPIMRGENRYNVAIITYYGDDMRTTTEYLGVSLTKAVELFYKWDNHKN